MALSLVGLRRWCVSKGESFLNTYGMKTLAVLIDLDGKSSELETKEETDARYELQVDDFE